MTVTRRFALASATLVAAPSVARAQTPRRLRMATSWPRNLPGPGVSAERLAARIGRLTGGALDIQVFSAGDIVPAFGVQEAVGNGTVEMGHTASFFGMGREPAQAFFTTIPFGFTPLEHVAWLTQGGGQALWDELGARNGVKPLLGGNTGVSMGGWFRRELTHVDELKGLKIRMTGLGAELFQRLGATAIAVPPGDIYPALERGVIDAAEFTSPGADLALGLWRVAPVYAAPGFNKPNGASELLIAKPVWDSLDPAVRAAIETASEAEHHVALAEMEKLNMDALATMVGQHGVRLRGFPIEMLRAAKREAASLLGDLGTRSSFARQIHGSYTGFQERLSVWTRLSTHAVLAAREV
ncbi:MAG: TRAP transporter substrate-binding protein [Alphaproteobacteria bacterium]